MNVTDVFSQHRLHIQHSPFACGPSALLNVLHLKGDFSRSEEELIKLCDAQANIGTSNENLVKAARHLGLQVVEEKANGALQDIERHLDGSSYVIVNYFQAFSRNGHYAVVTEHDDRALYLLDSSLGFLRLWKKDFQKFWYNSDQTIYGWYAAVK